MTSVPLLLTALSLAAAFAQHEFVLAELPEDLAAVLADYDVDESGTVSVAELVAGAQLMRQQAKKVSVCASLPWGVAGAATVPALC